MSDRIHVTESHPDGRMIMGYVAPARPMVIQCAWCRRVKHDALYVEAAPAAEATVSHGICPDCLEKVKAMKEAR